MENELIRSYELSFIIDAHLSSADKESVCQELKDIIEKVGGEVKELKGWIEQQKLAFPIKKVEDGSYYILTFEGKSNVVEDIKPLIKLKERILRFLVIKQEETEPINV